MKGTNQDFYRRLVARDYYVSTVKHSSISAPSSNRTCGFPAYGSPEDCRQRHTQGVARLGPLQINQSEFLQMIVIGLPFRQTERPLAPSSQMDDHPTAYKMVYIPEGLTGIAKTEVVAPSFKMPVYPHDKIRHGHKAILCSSHMPQTFSFPAKTHLGRTKIQKSVWPSFQIFIKPEGKTQKIQTFPFLTQIDNPCLFPVDLQTHPGLNLPGDPILELIPLVSGQNDKSSSPGESHPQALTEPDVNVSAHPAPMVQQMRKVVSNEQTSLAAS